MRTTFAITCFLLAASMIASLADAEEPREERPRFKGVELYSWQDDAGNWRFVLVDGTNRDKTEDEIKSHKNPLKSVEQLTLALAQLAVGEQVFWTRQTDGFAHPSKKTRKAILDAAKAARVDLFIDVDE